MERRRPKSEWGPGPWQGEPDRLEWKHRGLVCLARRSPLAGNWCGYVAVPPGHPWHGKDYAEVEAEVHGGITYSAACKDDVCHVPAPGEPDDVWWLGFDCAHAFDYQPGLRAMLGSPGGPVFDRSPFPEDVYRTLDYVKAETEQLADQVVAARA